MARTRRRASASSLSKPSIEHLSAGRTASLRIGTGVGHLYYYGRQILFKDAMLQSQPFWAQPNDSTWPLGTEASPFAAATAVAHVNGYPQANPAGGGWWKTVMRTGLAGNYESGTWHVIHDGNCRIRVWGDNAGRGSAAVFNNTGGTFTLTTPGNDGLHLELDQIVTPPTRIAVVPAAYVASYVAEPFHPQALSSMAHYSILRFMDQCGPFSELTNWADRTTMGWQTQHRELNQGAIANPLYNTYGGWARRWNTDFGMAVEYMVDLCNALGVSLWVCIPPKATDDYVTQMVTLIRDRLRADLGLYIEYGNEDWNSAFPQMVWMAGQANTRAEVQVPWSTLSWMTPGAATNEQAPVLAQIFQAWRGRQIMNLARNVFAATQRKGLVRVFGMQTADWWSAEQALMHQQAHRDFDVLSPNGYWSHNEGAPWGQSESTWLGYCVAKIGEVDVDYPGSEVAEYFTSYGLNVGNPVSEQWRAAARLASRFGLGVAGYEAGQHITGSTPEQRAEWELVQAHPDFYHVYVHMCRVWKRIFGSDATLVHYYDCGNWGTAGTWGARTLMSDVTAKKYLALKDVATGAVRF